MHQLTTTTMDQLTRDCMFGLLSMLNQRVLTAKMWDWDPSEDDIMRLDRYYELLDPSVPQYCAHSLVAAHEAYLEAIEWFNTLTPNQEN